MFDELLRGWAKTFDEIALLDQYRAKAVVMKYAHNDCFDLAYYTPERFPPGNELLDRVPGEVIVSYEEYGLGPDGLPCYCRTVYENDTRRFAGFYRYSQEAVEYVQYNLNNGIPYVYQRMGFEAGRKVSFQKAVANDGGTCFEGMTGAEAMEKAREEVRSLFLYVDRYEYEGGRIVRDHSNSRAAGPWEYGYEGRYTYREDGELMEIKDVFSNGRERLRFCYWDASEGIYALTGRLVREMAAAIVEVLSAEKLASPLAILELGYHYEENYIPVLNPLSAAEKNQVIAGEDMPKWAGLFLHENWLMETELKGIERTYAQFMQQVKHLADEDMARDMLRMTASFLTTSRLMERIPVEEEFIAYAIDGHMEGEDAVEFKDILLECGMGEDLYERWRQRGWVK